MLALIAPCERLAVRASPGGRRLERHRVSAGDRCVLSTGCQFGPVAFPVGTGWLTCDKRGSLSRALGCAV
jgi:hypothetical protein